MRIPHYLRRAPSGRWQFIQRVPADLADWFGKRWLKHMLTADQRAAQVGALALASRYAWAFARVRAGAMSKDEEKALRAGLAHLTGTAASRADWKIKDGGGGPPTFETEPHDTPATLAFGAERHDKAMASWERVELEKTKASAMFQAEAYQRAMASIHAPQPEPAKKTPALGDQIVLYFATEHDGKRAQTMKTRRRVADTFADFHEVGKGRPVGEISKEQVVAWLDHLRTNEALSKPSVANYASHLRVIFGWMVERGTITTNPFERVGSFKPREKKQRRAEGYGWEPFGENTLRRLFASANLEQARMDHVRWGAFLGLYTGARVGEIGQVLLRDFETRDGQPCLMIRADGAGQRLKTDQSARIVPIHPDLIRLGLLDEVSRRRRAAHDAAKAVAEDNGQSENAAELIAAEAADAAQFFSIRTDRDNGKGDTISKGFSNLLGALGVTPKNDTGTVGFHSFRKTMTQALQGTSVPEERRRAFLGHEPGDGDSHATAYMRPWTASELAAVFDGIRWGEWLDFDGLRAVLSSGQKGQRRVVKKAAATSKKKSAKSGLAGKKK